jgi:hypothetical protein
MTQVGWIHAALALASIGSILVGRPWTTRLARRHTRPEVWSTDLFRETNVVVTATWALLFAAGALLAAVASPWAQLPYGALLVLFGRLSPGLGSWYSGRRLRAMGVAS